jgi:pyruvate dehydrogenase E2 component (dihydrolipoamide acetyltransferase)
LQAQEFEGGTFSLSNLGMFGVRQFDAIINPPQAAILAVGAAEKRIVARDDRPAVATVMSLSLACDHRVIDGALAARFLQVLKALLQQPAALSP